MTTWDVVVIGGGAAGLAAARDLGRAGAKTLLVEAKSRLGGRIRTIRPHGWPAPVELGAEFVHGRRPEVFELAEESGLVLGRVPNVHLEAHGAGLRPIPEVWKRFESLTSRMKADGEDRSVAEFLDSRRSLGESDRRLVASIVEGYDAAPLDRASEKALSTAGEGRLSRKEREQFRVLSGYDGVIRALAGGARSAGCRIELSTAIAQVEWSAGRVDLKTASGRRIRARRAIVTLPIGVLKAPPGARGALRFRPDPPPLRRALSRIEMGQAVRVSMRFREPFWRERLGGRPDVAFLHAPQREPFPTLWTSAPLELPMLTLWAGGPAAVRLPAGRGEVLEVAIGALSRLFRARPDRIRGLLSAAHVHDWSRDPFSRGAYSYVAVGGAEAPSLLARPIAGTLFFAGEATAPDETGTVPGAIASGRRAARRILRV
jgi:monoamine oxidase